MLPPSVGAEGGHSQSRGHRGRRAAAGTARVVGEVPRVLGPGVEVRLQVADGEFSHGLLAQKHGPSLVQSRYYVGVDALGVHPSRTLE